MNIISFKCVNRGKELFKFSRADCAYFFHLRCLLIFLVKHFLKLVLFKYIISSNVILTMERLFANTE